MELLREDRSAVLGFTFSVVVAVLLLSYLTNVVGGPDVVFTRSVDSVGPISVVDTFDGVRCRVSFTSLICFATKVRSSLICSIVFRSG